MLPIGTVVYNSNTENLQMIISYYPIDKETGKQFEYLTCLYPYGYGPDIPYYLINKSDFKYIVHEGLEMAYFDKFASEVEKIAKQPNENAITKITEIDLSKFTEL